MEEVALETLSARSNKMSIANNMLIIIIIIIININCNWVVTRW